MLGWFRTLGLGALSPYLRGRVGLGAQVTTTNFGFLNKVQVESGNRPKLGPEEAWLWGWAESSQPMDCVGSGSGFLRLPDSSTVGPE